MNDLLLFNNLNKLTLKNLNVNNDDVILLSQLSNLRELNLINCEVEDFDNILTNNIDKIKLDNTYISKESLQKKYNYLELKNYNSLDAIIDVDTLCIVNSIIPLESINFNNIKNVIISDDTYSKSKDIISTIVLTTTVIIKDKYDEVVKVYEKN